MMWWHDGMSGWGYPVMTLISLLWLALLAFGVVVLVRYLTPATQRHDPRLGSDPEQVLAGRYARGEIDEAEFHRRLENLRSAGHASTNA